MSTSSSPKNDNAVIGSFQAVSTVPQGLDDSGALAAWGTNKVILVGGYTSVSSSSNSVSAYDMVTKQWTSLPPLLQARSESAAIVVRQRLYVFGGYNDSGNYLSSCEVLDLTHLNASSKFQPLPPLKQGLSGIRVFHKGELIFLVGGANINASITPSFSIFNIATQQFPESVPGGHLARRRAAGGLVGEDQDTLLIVGGDLHNGKMVPTQAVEAWSISRQEWIYPTPQGTPADSIVTAYVGIVGASCNEFVAIEKTGNNSVATVEYTCGAETLTVKSVGVNEDYIRLAIFHAESRSLFLHKKGSLLQAKVTMKFAPPPPGEAETSGAASMEDALTAAVSQSLKPFTFWESLLRHEVEEESLPKHLSTIASLVTDLLQFKFFYTMTAGFYAMGEISLEERNKVVNYALSRSVRFVIDDDTYAIFRLYLDKLQADGAITQQESDKLQVSITKEQVVSSSYIQAMRQQIDANTKSIQSLQRTVAHLYVQVNDMQQAFRSMQGALKTMEENMIRTSKAVIQLQEGLRRKYRVEACVSFLSSVLNAVSLGVAGNAGQDALTAMLDGIVDFGDVPHICDVAATVVETVEGCTLENLLEVGLEMVENKNDEKLQEAVKNKNVLVLIGYCAGSFAAHCHRISSIQYSKDLSLEDEVDFPYHAAVKFNDMEELQLCVARYPEKLNTPDKRNRTPTDFAAICGRVEMVNFLREKGGDFLFRSPPRMKAYCKTQAAILDGSK